MKKISFRPGLYYDATTTTAEMDFDPPVPASQVIPEWYRKAGQFFHGDDKIRLLETESRISNTTYKRCVPFMDAMTHGYIFTLADDVLVERKAQGEFSVGWRTRTILLSNHEPVQHPNFPIPDGYLQKVLIWSNGYSILLPSGYSLMCTHPFNRFDLPFTTLTGIIDADNFEGQVHFPFILRNDFEGIIPRGTPVAQLVPIKRDDWESSVIKSDPDEEYRRVRRSRGLIERSYKTLSWKKKTFR